VYRPACGRGDVLSERDAVTNPYLSTIRAIVKRFPAVIPHLKGRARYIAFMYTPYLVEAKGYKWNIGEFLNTARLNKWIPESKTYDYFLLVTL